MRDTPAEFRVACERIGITLTDLANRYTDGRKDNVRKWFKTQVPPEAAWEWLEEREAAVEQAAQDMAREALDAVGSGLGYELLTYRTDYRLQSDRDDDMTALQHRLLTARAYDLVKDKGHDLHIEFWEEY